MVDGREASIILLVVHGVYFKTGVDFDSVDETCLVALYSPKANCNLLYQPSSPVPEYPLTGLRLPSHMFTRRKDKFTTDVKSIFILVLAMRDPCDVPTLTSLN